ncbi:MAG: rod-binding protein [Sulfuricurvum sp.]|uniref:rod-binding protein n=1 Tax=Sulfuricurvum sp. TaxID=2025608 RepID=UPI0026125EF9|nr:rod-binding protein [Sulfuricurvum sp.]MDD2837497.1 rod-binding protein [Sulfuricurvum sp.]MDD3596331.1 rod-binding protein [Sulfuricurvum sp.]MDD4883494.1 rod-binding protein [Sulfuricurvum sp.]
MDIANVQYQKAVPTIGSKENNAALREKTDQFEAIIVKMMLDEAMKEDKNVFTSTNDPGDKIYKSMYREELSNASAGSFGFSQMLYDNLSQKGVKVDK